MNIGEEINVTQNSKKKKKSPLQNWQNVSVTRK